ncbi:MAG TPA: DUF5916 domain-containing protein [Bacteroidales bacterium]|nr:DUF5916 domain-containing protein [Bacteroidales bacterium]
MTERFFITFTFLLFFLDASPQESASFKAYMSDAPISVDGYLDESPWRQSPLVTDFIQFEPDEGKTSSRKTEIRILFGRDNLYIGATMYDRKEDIENNLGRRDEYNRADWFMVSIDSYDNRKTAFTFAVNAAGVQLDGQQDDNRKLSVRDANPLLPEGLDPSWDAIWFSDVNIENDKWIAEIRIPYSMLRYSRNEIQTWGIQFRRRIPKLGEVSEWPYIPRSERTNLVSGYGRITEIKGIDPRRNIQIRPYMLAGLDLFENENVPGTADSRLKYDAGGDIKIGIGPNIMLDATISPDFGQVEADPAVLNLTAFETFFAEKRPFFLEGADIFKFGIGNSRLFYSRRLGSNEPIIAAGKLSGHSENGLSFGLLGTTAGKNFNPVNNYGVFRASKTLGHYSSAGGILTYYHSPAETGTGWQSITGGVDWDLRFNDNKYSFEGITAFSDRNPLVQGVDKETGAMSGLVLRKRQGIVDGHFTLLLFTDKYNPNDLGWISFEQNWYQIWSNVNYKIKGGKSFGSFQRGEVSLYYTRRYSFLEWYDMGSNINLSTELTTKKFRLLKFGGKFYDLLGGYDLWETRGLGIWAKPASVELSGELNSDERRNWKITPKGTIKKYNNNGSEYTIDFQSIINAGTRLSFQANLKANWEDYKTAWASNETFMEDNGTWEIGNLSTSPDNLESTDFTAFDDMGMLGNILADVKEYNPGQYYLPVFGTRDTRSIDLTLRGALTFTSKFSMQLYTQFFVAKGKYDNFKILTTPDDMVDFPAYPKRRDFNYKNLQSNFVTRWEYRPGSAIYFVWSHSRNRDDVMNPLAPWGDSLYEQSFGGQITDIFRIFPKNSFMIKIDYAFH